MFRLQILESIGSWTEISSDPFVDRDIMVMEATTRGTWACVDLVAIGLGDRLRRSRSVGCALATPPIVKPLLRMGEILRQGNAAASPKRQATGGDRCRAGRAGTRTNRFAFTMLGGLMSVVAVVVWIATFAPHGGVDLSGYLFPVWSWIASALYAGRSVPALVWYGGILLHWVVLGALVDLLRARLRGRGGLTVGDAQDGSPPLEHLIVGKWVDVAGGVAGDEACVRIRSLVEHHFEFVASHPKEGGWRTLFRDPRDGRLWERVYLQSHLQGGGPPCLRHISPEEAKDAFELPSGSAT